MLPLFIHRNNRWSMALLCGVAFLLGYTIPNHFHLFEPQLLPLTSLDRAVRFDPWWIFIYQSEYVLFAAAYFAFDDELNRNRYVWAYFGVLLAGAAVFVLFPTTYPRANYPLPPGLDAATYWAFTFLRAVDTPANCFPSMHVTCCYLTAFAFTPKNESRWKLALFTIWATAVAVSTLPTKQHYVADVLGGLVLSWLGYYVFFRWARYLPLPEFVAELKARATARLSQ